MYSLGKILCNLLGIRWKPTQSRLFPQVLCFSAYLLFLLQNFAPVSSTTTNQILKEHSYVMKIHAIIRSHDSDKTFQDDGLRKLISVSNT